jgi:hypothetical protein
VLVACYRSIVKRELVVAQSDMKPDRGFLGFPDRAADGLPSMRPTWAFSETSYCGRSPSRGVWRIAVGAYGGGLMLPRRAWRWISQAPDWVLCTSGWRAQDGQVRASLHIEE